MRKFYMEKQNKIHAETERLMNKKSKKEDIIEQEDKVLIKVNCENKLDQFWEGPFEVIEVGKNKSTVLINKDGKNNWISLRRVKKDLRRGRML